MKFVLRGMLEPAVRLVNRLSYPRKFAVVGMLFALPLILVTCQYAGLLNESVEVSRQGMVCNRALRTVVPLWRTLCERRRGMIESDTAEMATSHEADRVFREVLSSQLNGVSAADDGVTRMLSASARWEVFQPKLQALLDLARAGQNRLNDRAVLTDLIHDLTTIFRQLVDPSVLAIDPDMGTRSLVFLTSRLIPELVEADDRFWELAAANTGTKGGLEHGDLEMAEALGVLRATLNQVKERLDHALQFNEKSLDRLTKLRQQCLSNMDSVQGSIRKNLHAANQTGTLHSETTSADAAVLDVIFELHAECQNSFDRIVGERCDTAYVRRFSLILSVVLPAMLAIYFGAGFCLSIIRTVHRMREVTDRALANDWRGSNLVVEEAQDEVGRMIADFGRLTSRLHEEWVAARAEALRASAAQESLRVSEERFALALRGTNDGIWDWDLQTDHVYYSARFKELLGYRDDEFGVWLSALADVLHPDDFDDTWTAIERHLGERVPYHIEHRLRTRSGEYRWYLERGQAVWDENGNAVRMAGSISDIHEGRIIEAHERIRAAVMEALANSLPLDKILEVLVRALEVENRNWTMTIMLLDEEGRHLLNGATSNLPAFYNEAIQGVEIGPNVGSCGAAATTGKRVVVEDVQSHPNWLPYRDLVARAGFASCWSEPILCESGTGKVIGTFAVYGSKIGGPSETDIQFIEAAARLAGIAIERKRIEDESRRYLKQVEESRDHISEQAVQLVRQSEELSRARDEAEAAARVKSEFLANMSHELRTPLTAILGYADLLYDEGDMSRAPTARLESIDVIRTNGRHLQALIDDILDLSKIEAGRMTLEKSAVSPVQLSADVLRLMQLRAREKNLVLLSEVHYPLPDLVSTDVLRLRQILVNLVGNAIKFTEQGSVIVSVGYDQATERLRYVVVDTGIGMEPDQVRFLFTPFSQADTSMSRRFGGTGLGLSISRRLARMLGGDIRVESQSGKGSSFILEISVERPEGSVILTSAERAAAPIEWTPTPMPPANVTSATRLSGRILLVEDVIANQKLISFLLQKNGAEVEVVENGQLAVTQSLSARDSGHPFDLILMDIQMPIMDGNTATTTLRQAGYQGQIVALTAHATTDDRQRCLDSGFDGFAVKPIQRDKLIATCREHLALVRMQPCPA